MIIFTLKIYIHLENEQVDNNKIYISPKSICNNDIWYYFMDLILIKYNHINLLMANLEFHYLILLLMIFM